MRRSYSSQFRLLLVAAFYTAVTGSTLVQAERYQVDKIKDEYRNPRELKRLRQTTSDVMRGKRDFAAFKADVDEYYLSYFFPAMTNPEKRGELASMRIELTSDLGNCSNEDVHTHVRDLAYKQCKAHLSGKYHPSVRYNCTLLLGDLNQSISAKTEPPVPYRPALKDLARGLGNPKLDDAMLTATLIGVQRHAQLSGHKSAPQSLYNDLKVRNYLISKLGRLANTATAPDGRSNSGHQWMRQIAVQSLGYLRAPGKSNAVANLLVRIATRAKSPIPLRCAAIEALARLDLEGSGMKGTDLVETAGQVLYAACQAEYDAINDELKESMTGRGRYDSGRAPRPTTMRPGAPGEGRPPRGQMQQRRPANEFIPDDPATVHHRRRLIHQLVTVRQALDGEDREGIPGIKSMEGADKKAAALIDIIDTLQEDAQDGTTDLVGFGRKIGAARNEVAGLIKTKPPKPIDGGV